MVGMVIGLVLLFSYLTILLLSLAAVPPVLIHVASKVLGQSARNTSALTVLLGAVVTFFVLLIPILGGLLLFIIFVLSLGAVIAELYQKIV